MSHRCQVMKSEIGSNFSNELAEEDGQARRLTGRVPEPEAHSGALLGRAETRRRSCGLKDDSWLKSRKGICKGILEARTSHHLQQRVSHNRWGGGDGDAGFFEGGDFGGGRAFAAADNSARMTHAAPRGSSRSGDETGDGFFAIRFNPLGGFLLGGSADLADHDDAMRVRIRVEELDDIQMRGAVDGIPSDADASGLPNAA